jgi:hypothetical protein
LKPEDLIEPGHTFNYGERKKATYVYLTGTLDAAIPGGGAGSRPRTRENLHSGTGPIMDDPNLADKKYLGNPTKSYRSRQRYGSRARSRIGRGTSPKRSRP